MIKKKEDSNYRRKLPHSATGSWNGSCNVNVTVFVCIWPGTPPAESASTSTAWFLTLVRELFLARKTRAWLKSPIKAARTEQQGWGRGRGRGLCADMCVFFYGLLAPAAVGWPLRPPACRQQILKGLLAEQLSSLKHKSHLIFGICFLQGQTSSRLEANLSIILTKKFKIWEKHGIITWQDRTCERRTMQVRVPVNIRWTQTAWH